LIYGVEQDAVGGPTRLSYAQVAQHHKEKVERMLREKQNTEQEKEKDKERKKEVNTSRLAQHHGDVRGQFLEMCLFVLCSNNTKCLCSSSIHIFKKKKPCGIISLFFFIPLSV
jgi:hypothetical protein